MAPKNDVREWLSSMSKRRITAVEIADILDVSRTTANARIAKGLTADDIICVCRGLNLNPVDALVELDYLDYEEVMTFMDSDGKLIDTATEGELSLELARRLNPAIKAEEIDQLESNSNLVRLKPSHPGVPFRAVADGSDYHDEENSEFDD